MQDACRPVGPAHAVLKLERAPRHRMPPGASHGVAIVIGHAGEQRTAGLIGRAGRQPEQCPEALGCDGLPAGEIELERRAEAEVLRQRQHPRTLRRGIERLLHRVDVGQRDQVRRLAPEVDEAAADPRVHRASGPPDDADVVRTRHLAGTAPPDLLEDGGLVVRMDDPKRVHSVEHLRDAVVQHVGKALVHVDEAAIGDHADARVDVIHEDVVLGRERGNVVHGEAGQAALASTGSGGMSPAASGSSGIQTRKALPCPTADLTLMTPLCFCTMENDSDSPSPVPLPTGLVV